MGVELKLATSLISLKKGFTGDSGETRKKSTGMGLYLVKQLADALKIDIVVKSEWMHGFEISLSIS